jgi:hypothetical protein
MANLIDVAAELGSEESDYDSDTGEARHKENGATRFMDSSEEEDSEDEEAERAVRIAVVYPSDF